MRQSPIKRTTLSASSSSSSSSTSSIAQPNPSFSSVTVATNSAAVSAITAASHLSIHSNAATSTTPAVAAPAAARAPVPAPAAASVVMVKLWVANKAKPTKLKVKKLRCDDVSQRTRQEREFTHFIPLFFLVFCFTLLLSMTQVNTTAPLQVLLEGYCRNKQVPHAGATLRRRLTTGATNSNASHGQGALLSLSKSVAQEGLGDGAELDLVLA